MQFRKKSYNEQQNEKLIQLPFYGVRGSIKKIVEDGNYYLVTRYGSFGEDGEVLPTPKKRKNEIRDNFVHDLKKYLENNHDKYLTILSEQSKKVFHKKKTMILAAIASAIAGLSAGATILTSSQFSYLLLTIFFVSFIVSCYQIHDLKEIMKEEKRQKFIHQYKHYSNELNMYNIQKEKIKKYGDTRYSNVYQHEEDKVIDINKKRIKKKEEFIA